MKTSKNLSLPLLLCWLLWNPSLCVLKLNIGTSMTMLNGIVKSSCIIQRILHSHLIDISTILQQIHCFSFFLFTCMDNSTTAMKHHLMI